MTTFEAKAFVRSDPLAVAKWFASPQRSAEELTTLKSKGLTDFVETEADQDGKRVRILTWKADDGSTVEIRTERTLGSDGTNLLPIRGGYRTERRDLIHTTDPNGQDATQRVYLLHDFTQRRGGVTEVRRTLAVDNPAKPWWQRVRPEMAAQDHVEEALDQTAARCEAEIAPGLRGRRPRPGRSLRLAQGGATVLVIGVILYTTIHTLGGKSHPSNRPSDTAVQIQACHPPAVLGKASEVTVDLIGGDQGFQVAWSVDGVPDHTDQVARATTFNADRTPVVTYTLTLVPTDTAEQVSVSVVGGSLKWQHQPVMGPHSLCPIYATG